MDRRFFNRTGLGLVAGLGALFAGTARAAAADAAGKPHKIVVQMSSGDRQTQILALGNAGNYASYYKDKGEPFQIEIVAFGPGYQMVRADVSLVKVELGNLQTVLGGALVVSACQNSRRVAAKSEGRQPEDIPQLPGVADTPSGIVRVAALQEQGWSYVRP